jgi:hypothetical protein
MFLAATEADRLQRMHPAGRTPELHEKFLPYALALNIEQQWTKQFSDVLSAAAQPGGGGGAYHPRWYTGSDWDGSRVSGFAGSVGSSLSGAISSSSSTPGSGSGGGGSSGGGGGSW